jgi:hypothetical protein
LSGGTQENHGKHVRIVSNEALPDMSKNIIPQNCLGSGLCALSGILKTSKHNFWKLDVQNVVL